MGDNKALFDETNHSVVSVYYLIVLFVRSYLLVRDILTFREHLYVFLNIRKSVFDYAPLTAIG